MRIGFTSLNFKTITGHAGRTNRFLVFDLAEDGTATELDRLDLPTEMSMHEFHQAGPHPLDALDVLVTKECGAEFITRMAGRGVRVVMSPEDTDPASVLKGIAEGRVDVSGDGAHECACGHGHDDHDHAHGHGHRHGSGQCCGGHGLGHRHGHGR
jgi:predicted Fe-Mo cluster-binding NifX family protein